jgi:AraC family transcriptional regulator
MSHYNHQNPLAAQLKPGQFYGQVMRKRHLSGVVMSELKHVTGRKLPEHSHQLAYLCLLLGGEYTEYLNQKAVPYKELTVMFHPPEFAHRDEVGKTGGHFFNVEIEASWMNRLSEYTAVPQTIMSTQGGDLTWLMLRLYREFRQPDICSPLAIEGLVMALLTDVTRLKMKNERKKPDWLARATDLIRAQFQDNLTIIDVAANVGIHPFHLSRVFKQFHNQSVGEFVNRLRVEFACHQLGSFETTLAEVALAAGFSDQSHFTRVFKRVTGMTPKVFRNTIEGGCSKRAKADE